MSQRYTIAESIQMEKRKVLAEEFYNAILDPTEIPYIVTDMASLYDIFAGDESELIRKVQQKYGVKISEREFKIPFWELLDFLNERADKQVESFLISKPNMKEVFQAIDVFKKTGEQTIKCQGCNSIIQTIEIKDIGVLEANCTCGKSKIRMKWDPKKA